MSAAVRLNCFLSKCTINKLVMHRYSWPITRSLSDSNNYVKKSRGAKVGIAAVPAVAVKPNGNNICKYNLEYVTEMLKQHRYKTTKGSNEELQVLVAKLDQAILRCRVGNPYFLVNLLSALNIEYIQNNPVLVQKVTNAFVTLNQIIKHKMTYKQAFLLINALVFHKLPANSPEMRRILEVVINRLDDCKYRYSLTHSLTHSLTN